MNPNFIPCSLDVRTISSNRSTDTRFQLEPQQKPVAASTSGAARVILWIIFFIQGDVRDTGLTVHGHRYTLLQYADSIHFLARNSNAMNHGFRYSSTRPGAPVLGVKTSLQVMLMVARCSLSRQLHSCLLIFRKKRHYLT